MFLAAPLLPGRASAQRGNDMTRAAALAAPELRSVVDQRLSSLSRAARWPWKFHVGDIAHGEDVDLDESSWLPIEMNQKAPNEAVWFRQSFQVPVTLNGYDLTGARIWFQFHANGNGPMPEILYFNGRRVALGEDLEPVVLFDQAKPGEKVTVAVKLLHTVDTKTFRGATLRD